MPFPLQPNPRTWSANDIVTVPRLRADVSNVAWLLTLRPSFVGQAAAGTQTAAMNTVTPVAWDTEFIDNWEGHSTTSNPGEYFAKLPGWYLCEGDIVYGTTAGNGAWMAGIQVTQNSVTSDLFGQQLDGNGVDTPGPGATDLVQLDPATSDNVSLFAFQTSTASAGLSFATYFKAEWVALPSLAFTDGVLGTVVSNPVAAALWPPGAGTKITNAGGIAAGATSMTVTANTGIVVNGTLGLDYYEGTAVVPTAETVSVTSVAGTTIGISATTYPHGGTTTPGYVAVPVSAAFFNQQVRDAVNFLAFPPILRAQALAGQSLTTQTFPASTTISMTFTSVDNFAGWNGSTAYTFPVSGLYYVYACLPFPAAVNNYHIGISISGGTTQWGDSLRNQASGNPASVTFRKHIRVTSGQTLTLQACVTTNNVTVTNNANTYAVLIVVFRGF